jgi:RND superfamily putative drug exporter
VLAGWLLAAVLVVVASAGAGKELEDSFGAPGLDSQRATDLLARSGADQAGLTAAVVLTPRNERATFVSSAGARAALTRVEAAINRLPSVLHTTDVVSPDGRVALVRVQYPVLDELAPRDLANLEEALARARTDSPVRIELGGDLSFAFEEPGTGAGELLGIGVAVVILLVAFGSVVAMGLPIGMALFGLAFAVSALPLVAHLIDVPSWAPVIGAMVGLGVGIDYALFVITRHRDHLRRGRSVEDSAGRAVATAGRAVLFAGGTVVIAILGLAVAGIPFVTAAGVAVSVVVLVMVAASVTLLPAFLGLAGHRIDRTLLRRRPAVEEGAGTRSIWWCWGRHVSRHPWAYAAGGTVALLALTAPVLALRVGSPDDGALPETRTERRAYDLVEEGFGPGSNGPLVVAVDVSEDGRVVGPLARAIEADHGVAGVGPPDVTGNVATLVALPATGPQDAATQVTIERLRSEVFPRVLAGSPARAHIGGQTAAFADVAGRVADRLPWLIGAVVSLSCLLLTLVFRSVLVPLKAAALNLLSIGASYGVMVMVFQWGWGADVIGLESTVPIVSFIPMFMFAILFGLSMDYEVFLLSRVREEYLDSGDNETSVVRGVASTGRVITSAALIMIAVFLGFVVSDDPFTKMFGLGLATAILVDATVVRMVLVPATMKLLGDANWWLPRWLDRVLPGGGSPVSPGRDAAPAPAAEEAALV